MRQWLFLLGSLLVWTAHFFSIYIAASLFPGTALARWLTAGLTLAALLATVLIMRVSWRRWGESAPDHLQHWIGGIAVFGAGLAAVAILYQGLPAMLS